MAQSEEYFVVSKRLGKQMEFVRFPECNHLFLRTGHPKMREEYLDRTVGVVSEVAGVVELAFEAGVD